MSISFIGTNGQGPRKWEYKQNKYPVSHQTCYLDNYADAMYSASVYFNWGWDVDVTEGNPYTLEAVVNAEVGSTSNAIISSTGSYYTVNWSMHYVTPEKELLEVNTNTVAWINQISQQDKATLQNYIANPTGSMGWTGSLQSTASLTAYNLMTSGQRTVPIVQPILRQTLVVTNQFVLTGYNTNLLGVYSLSTLTSAIGIPTNWYDVMNLQTYGTVTNNSIPYNYGWQRQPPTMDQNGVIITITQDYVYGLYPQNIYGTLL